MASEPMASSKMKQKYLHTKGAKGEVIQPNARPGDFKWVDTNNDGKINNDDKTFWDLIFQNIPLV